MTELRPWPGDVRYSVSEDGTILGVRGQPKKCSPNPVTGYLQVGIGHARTVRVHVMVCETFHGPRPEGKEVAHGNGNQLDCSAANLRWATRSENAQDRVRHGTAHSKPPKAEAHFRAKLTLQEVRAIRAAWCGGEAQRSLARRYGLDKSTVRDLVTGKTWTDSFNSETDLRLAGMKQRRPRDERVSA